MQTGPMPLPPAPRKPRNNAAITFAVIAIVLFVTAATFGILYSEKANDFNDQADQLQSVEAERDALDDAKAELENEIVALQLERDNLQADSDARQVCSDALDTLIADEYPGTIDDLEDLASSEYLEWAQAHDELYREVERQCLA
jgi:chromosome segregation ATPase